eukprot:TRINITY_DN17420_c0_g4_i1.p1 TRINITY_DN17420_c0_g4~~TRINITY_DN17420_c0_g4_i1.p1  ORF type:complete len:920 (-),score=83.43 TRINITY_DN17420_c0_g4_i1:130-2889(-)
MSLHRGGFGSSRADSSRGLQSPGRMHTPGRCSSSMRAILSPQRASLPSPARCQVIAPWNVDRMHTSHPSETKSQVSSAQERYKVCDIDCLLKQKRGPAVNAPTPRPLSGPVAEALGAEPAPTAQGRRSARRGSDEHLFGPNVDVDAIPRRRIGECSPHTSRTARSRSASLRLLADDESMPAGAVTTRERAESAGWGWIERNTDVTDIDRPTKRGRGSCSPNRAYSGHFESEGNDVLRGVGEISAANKHEAWQRFQEHGTIDIDLVFKHRTGRFSPQHPEHWRSLRSQALPGAIVEAPIAEAAEDAGAGLPSPTSERRVGAWQAQSPATSRSSAPALNPTVFVEEEEQSARVPMDHTTPGRRSPVQRMLSSPTLAMVSSRQPQIQCEPQAQLESETPGPTPVQARNAALEKARAAVSEAENAAVSARLQAKERQEALDATVRRAETNRKYEYVLRYAQHGSPCAVGEGMQKGRGQYPPSNPYEESPPVLLRAPSASANNVIRRQSMPLTLQNNRSRSVEIFERVADSTETQPMLDNGKDVAMRQFLYRPPDRRLPLRHRAPDEPAINDGAVSDQRSCVEYLGSPLERATQIEGVTDAIRDFRTARKHDEAKSEWWRRWNSCEGSDIDRTFKRGQAVFSPVVATQSSPILMDVPSKLKYSNTTSHASKSRQGVGSRSPERLMRPLNVDQAPSPQPSAQPSAQGSAQPSAQPSAAQTQLAQTSARPHLRALSDATQEAIAAVHTSAHPSNAEGEHVALKQSPSTEREALWRVVRPLAQRVNGVGTSSLTAPPAATQPRVSISKARLDGRTTSPKSHASPLSNAGIARRSALAAAAVARRLSPPRSVTSCSRNGLGGVNWRSKASPESAPALALTDVPRDAASGATISQAGKLEGTLTQTTASGRSAESATSASIGARSKRTC